MIAPNAVATPEKSGYYERWRVTLTRDAKPGLQGVEYNSQRILPLLFPPTHRLCTKRPRESPET
jgi:hypothetical protein